ncbi:MAG: ribosome small subunit-dependent GTPase A [Flavobacteriaceae bacterium]|nr:ribosome small subunit-dependent GTPase A [Flavobacteriaceae bacterium]
MQGIVTKSTGSWYVVRTEAGLYTRCRIRGKFRMEGIKSTNPVAVGDVVDFELEPQKDTGVINHIHPRKNYIIRKSVNLSKQTHIIASNIDRAFLLITVANPVTMTSFIDRFIATAEAYSIPVILLFNKVDAFDEMQLQQMEGLKSVYEEIGYECLEVSAVTGRNVDLVKELMQDRVSLFSGHSGVGKSTLINSIEPTLNLKTTIVSEQSGQGQHTTTFAEMFELSFGGFIIDTPGIKGFGVVDFEKQEVGDYFPEIFHFKQFCKFNNCLHLEEPGCAVLEAVENDDIAFSRYRSYVQMLENDDIYRGNTDF